MNGETLGYEDQKRKQRVSLCVSDEKLKELVSVLEFKRREMYRKIHAGL